MNAEDWFNKGEYHLIDGHKLFVIDTDKDGQNLKQTKKPILCILHGFPTSTFDYWKVLDRLSETYRVVLHDHLGFGFSDKPQNYSYSLIEQTDIATRVWQQLGIEKATILAHDYGTSILTELLARDNQGFCSIAIEEIILCNGSMHIELAKLRLMQKLLRNKWIGHFVAARSSKKLLKRNLRNIYFDSNKIDDREIDAIWHMMTMNNGKTVLGKISQYTYERKQFWHRWIGALKNTKLPIRIIWPNKDPIAIAKMAQVIKDETNNSQLYWLENLGHFPMLEEPTVWCDKVLNKTSE